ncbi:antitoxin Phd_YefM of type II toxin-antitoxin system [Thermodesulfitimonas autotrophica]|uniref:Antitoxin Phd_YefM of type II toxin-antitoxin system n=1 Tax=Thermodesulfitimonas autotrophica TaxID=1894989 RepID=A0A3N5AXF5_9THEO|nr:type II toxin-antitoxin system Phd/YefM family antitoxin [Thermodesulfitimonas autotrophica]RPF49936.1 antitoxin Phd_YefM of type II toxin-antitoxin system [Thermodesulfitimonas autotrophica]
MKFISVRNLRLRSGEIWRQLQQEKEMVITLNGRPVAILAGVEGEDVMEYLATLRRTRAMLSVNKIQERARQTGKDKITAAEIDKEIRAVRRSRTR